MALAAYVALTALSAGAQVAAGQEANAAAQFRGEMADRSAADARARGEVEAGRRQIEARRAIGAARASMAASGIALDDGSALSIQEDIAAAGELDALTIRNNAAREAFGYRVEGDMSRLRGSAEQFGGYVGGFSTVVTAGGNYGAQKGWW